MQVQISEDMVDEHITRQEKTEAKMTKISEQRTEYL